MGDSSVTRSHSTSDPFREIEDCVIALHDALTVVGDCEGRELLDCVLRRLERAVGDVSETPYPSLEDSERGGSDGKA